ncbi:MAG: hypothetical protein DRP20_01350 [Thermotogae bacterium]|nr:MAG: hypothetical protein DRP20_01350 [Thermotogota bacterium]
MVTTLTNEKKINIGFAVISVILNLISWVVGIGTTFSAMRSFWWGQTADSQYFMHEGVVMLTGGVIAQAIIGIVAAIFMLIVLNQWNQSLTENIKNTKIMINYVKESTDDKQKLLSLSTVEVHLESLDLRSWAYWLYVGFYVISLFIPVMAVIFSLLAIIFLAIYLQSVFTVSKRLEEIKNTMYSVMGISTLQMQNIKSRNIGLFILFVIITLGIYWLYLLIKLSSEINNYLDTDQRLRQMVNP